MNPFNVPVHSAIRTLKSITRDNLDTAQQPQIDRIHVHIVEIALVSTKAGLNSHVHARWYLLSTTHTGDIQPKTPIYELYDTHPTNSSSHHIPRSPLAQTTSSPSLQGPFSINPSACATFGIGLAFHNPRQEKAWEGHVVNAGSPWQQNAWQTKSIKSNFGGRRGRVACTSLRVLTTKS